MQVKRAGLCAFMDNYDFNLESFINMIFIFTHVRTCVTIVNILLCCKKQFLSDIVLSWLNNSLNRFRPETRVSIYESEA